MKRFLLLAVIAAILLGSAVGFTLPECETENCQVCSSLGVCVMCNSNYMLKINKDKKTSECVERTCNIDKCSRCLTENICAQCQPGYKLNSSSLCIEIQDKSYEEVQKTGPCQIRSLFGKCEKCTQGFNLVDGECEINRYNFVSLALAASNCVPSATIAGNCQTCLTPNYCLTCNNQLSPNSQGICVPTCNINFCLLCASATTCSLCNSGYYLVNTAGSLIIGTCVLCTSPGCTTCTGSNFCTSCAGGYILNTTSNSCQLANCQYPCGQCTSSGCSSCLFPYNSAPFDNGTCFTCPIANCMTCSPQTPQVCTTCYPGYQPQNNGASCIFGCSPNCAPSACSQGVCSACLPGFFGSTGTPNCFTCDGAPICVSCTSTGQGTTSTCNKCMPGYYLNSNNACTACANPSCAICTPASNGQVCTTFMPQYITYTSTTVNYPNTVTAMTFAVICDPGCQTCVPTYPTACLTCYPGFSLQMVNSATACLPCTSNCATCVMGTPSNCLSCFGNAILSINTNGVGSCTPCNPSLNCVTCASNINVCTTCPFGYYLTNMGSGTVGCISGCPSNCLTCFNAQGTSLSGFNPNNIACSSCDAGYSLTVIGTCLPCVANCRVCTGQYQNQCIQCSVGFYLGSQLTCVACSTYCETCTAQGCTACIPGYQVALNSNSNATICVLACAYPCSTCLNNQPNACTSCMMGYTLAGNACSLSSCVTSITNNACEYCGLGSVLNANGACSNCSSNCARCSPTTLSQCTACYPGTYLTTSGTCVACSNGCATCFGQFNCMSCVSGYATLSYTATSTNTLPVVPVQTGAVTCVPCINPCATCTTNAQTCVTCIPGFFFTGWNCVSNFYYIFTATFDANQQVFFNHYQALISRFTYALQTTNNKAVSVQSIKSTQTTTSITVWLVTLLQENSDNSQAEYANLNFAFQQQDGQLAGMTELSSSLGVSTGKIDTTYNPAAVFLGIFIPFGIVAVFFIGYFICSQNNMDFPGSEYIPTAAPITEREATEMRSL